MLQFEDFVFTKWSAWLKAPLGVGAPLSAKPTQGTPHCPPRQAGDVGHNTDHGVDKASLFIKY